MVKKAFMFSMHSVVYVEANGRRLLDIEMFRSGMKKAKPTDSGDTKPFVYIKVYLEKVLKI